MSSNPFRKKALGTIDTARAGSPKSSLRSLDGHTADRKNKLVKKVRVLSPPPLSPDSPERPSEVPQPPVPLSSDAYSHANHHPGFDPFNGASTDESDGESIAVPPPDGYQPQLQQQQVGRLDARANPFSKTLQDIEVPKDLEWQRKEEGEVLKAANEGRKSLNVDSFKRLLMTGNAGYDASSASTEREEEVSMATAPSTAQADASEGNLVHSGSYEDSSDEATAESEDERRPAPYAAPSQPVSREKKAPPPPPSSRHGKSLKQRGSKDTKDDGHATTAPARRSTDGNDELRLDMDAANVAGGEADSGPPANSVPSSPNTKKSAPTPPPPRGHARTDSRSHESEASQRTSSDGVPARSDSTRSTGPAPAPPPPRRPHLAPKQTSPSSPGSPSSNTPTSTDQDHQDTSRSSHEAPPPSKHSRTASPPPPPPARQPSTRRTPSVTSIDAPSRRVSSEKKPRPPPSRHHRSSPRADGRKGSAETHTANPGKSAGILADLDALQREVDALRGQMK
ncbi:hypothetical protein ED733_006048 [Metarhizium rileyi]|uniref:Uncharacterized protein n=1 Tax=Metarhizium rileyi (strain RCEF 4871) TaxID=1649241 RepID=A0A5C6GG86_METRR|nr:hypothetical protein ED733_006048 [Metarhizium rileyi]